MPKGMNDAQIAEFAKRLVKTEEKGGFTGGKLSIEEFTANNPYLPGQVKTMDQLVSLLKEHYIPAIKENLGEDVFNKLNTNVLFELTDWNFNSDRSASDVLAYAAGEIDLDTWNGSGTNPVPANPESITLDKILAAKHDGYKTDGKDANGDRYTLDNPNPAYDATWKGRVGSTQSNQKTVKDAILNAGGTGTDEENVSTANELNKRMAEMRGKTANKGKTDEELTAEAVAAEEADAQKALADEEASDAKAAATENKVAVADEAAKAAANAKLKAEEEAAGVPAEEQESNADRVYNKIDIDKLQLGYTDPNKKVDEGEKRRFVRKLKEMSKEYGGASPEDFLSIMLKENGLVGGKLLLDQWSGKPTNDRGGHARGLIQFVPKTALGIMGYSKKEIEAMPLPERDRISKKWQDDLSNKTPTEQLEFVNQYYGGLGAVKKKDLKNYEDLYLGTFHPAAVLNGDDYVIASKEQDISRKEKAYESNQGVDMNGDGVVTKADFKEYAKKNLPTDSVDVFKTVDKAEYDTDYPLPDDISYKSKDVPTADGKYLTTYTTPDGTEKTITTDSPFKEQKIGLHTYVRDGKKFYEVNPDGLGKKKDIDAVYDSEWNGIKEKAKSKEHLTQKDLELSQTIYDLKKRRIEEQKDAYQTSDDRPFFNSDNVYKKGVINTAHYDKELRSLKRDYFTGVILPEEKAYFKEEYNAKKNKLEELEESLLNPDLTPTELANKRAQFNTEKDNWASYKKDVNKEWKTIKVLERVGTEVKSLNGTVMHTQGLDEDDFKSYQDRLNVRKPNIPLDQAAVDLIKKDKEAIKTAQTSTPNATGNANNASSSSSTTTTTTTNQVDSEATAADLDSDPGGFVIDDVKENPETAAYFDEESLLKQNSLDQETIDFIKSQKEFNTELPEEEYDYNNLLGNIADVGRGIVGMAGAMEEVPEYQRGDMFQESMDDATRMKNEGLSAQEKGMMKQNAERAFGFGMANVRGMSGGSGAAALVGNAQQASILQNQYGQIGAMDHQVRRENRQAFAQAAVQDERVNRQIFDDKLGQVTANKREGAALARDAYTNMNERAQFNQQYGKGSQYQQYMNEQILSNQQSRESLKQGDAMRKEKYVNTLEQQKQERLDKIRKNKAQQASQ